MLSADYFEQDMLLGAERDLWRNQNYERFWRRDYRLTTANPGSMSSITGDNPCPA